MQTLEVLFADSAGGDTWWLHENYLRAFPNMELIDHAPRSCTQPSHPHGYLCLSRFMLLFAGREDITIRVHLVPVISEVAPQDWMTWLLEKIREINPALWSNSWGIPRCPIPEIDEALAEFWRPWVEEEARLRAERGYFVLFAAGNKNTRGLAWPDVGHPARLMRGAIVVGAIDRGGVTTPWTADGNVDICEFGHYTWGLDPFTGEWLLWSGTSSSCPGEAAVVGDLLLKGAISNRDDLIAWYMDPTNVDRPEGFTDTMLPHPVFGRGSTIRRYETVGQGTGAFRCAGVPGAMPILAKGEQGELAFFDWTDLRRK